MADVSTTSGHVAWRGADSHGALSTMPFCQTPKRSPLQTWLNEHGWDADNINTRAANQTTPLMHAARLGHSDLIAELLLLGADITLRNADGNNALWLACFSGSAATVATLLAAGIDMDNRNDNGSTCLMYAASAGKAPVVGQLLAAGAALHIENLDGFTALDMAASIECLQLLRQAARNGPAA